MHTHFRNSIEVINWTCKYRSQENEVGNFLLSSFFSIVPLTKTLHVEKQKPIIDEIALRFTHQLRVFISSLSIKKKQNLLQLTQETPLKDYFPEMKNRPVYFFVE